MRLKPQQLQTLPAPKLHLDWLFVAFFKSGFTIAQTQEDKCLSRTDGTGSAFTDVLAHEEGGDELLGFELRHVDGKMIAGVNLDRGFFMVNGVPFDAHNQNFDPAAVEAVLDPKGEPMYDDKKQLITKRRYKLKLIYHRETRVERDQSATVQDDMSIKVEDVGELRHYINRYFIGWETVVNGQNKQVTIAVG